MASAAALNIVLSLALTPELGLEGPAVATAVAFALAFPFLLRLGLGAGGVRLGELARAAWLPAYSLGALLAGALVACASPLEPTGPRGGDGRRRRSAWRATGSRTTRSGSTRASARSSAASLSRS